MLRVKNMYNPFTEVGQLWYNKTREEGRKLHMDNLNRIERQRDEFYAEKEASIRSNMESLGYSNKKMDLLIEAWTLTVIKDPKTYRADRKQARELRKQAAELK